MRDDGTRIIDDFLNVCKVVQPDFNNNGSYGNLSADFF